MEATSFPVTRLLGERRLRNLSRRGGAEDGKRTMHTTLLGAVRPSGGGRPFLLYAQTLEDRLAPISNVKQVAATILGTSRKVFLSKILTLLRCMDPGKCEMCYIGECVGGE